MEKNKACNRYLVQFRAEAAALLGVKIAPRPYMAPALEKERPNLPLLWRNSIKKG